MLILRPHVVTDSTLASSSVAENDYSEWLVGSTYALNDYVIIATTTPNIHLIYKSAQGSNTGNDPVTDDGTWWVSQGATNRWKMFDDYVSSQTSDGTSISVSITPGELVNGIAMFNVEAETVQVTMVTNDSPQVTVYDTTVTMIDPPPSSGWYSWFFDEITSKATVVFLDLPVYKTATITVVISQSATSPETQAKCGALVFGKQYTIGDTEWGVGSGITDYSVKEVDSFGNFAITERSFSDRVEYVCGVETAQVSAVKKMLTTYRTSPLVWIGSTDYEAMITYGFMKDFDINFSNLTYSDVSIIVEGLT